MEECCQLGFVRAKFALTDDKELLDIPCVQWAKQFQSFRHTENFCYITLGHSDITENEHGRELLHTIARLRGWCTRLDFCIDIEMSMDLLKYYLGQRRVYNAAPKNAKPPLPQLIHSPRGNTVYVGSRRSSRMLRVYDKRAEILVKKRVDIGFDLVRVELEVKDKLVEVYRRLFLAGNTRAILDDIATRYQLEWLSEHPNRILPRETSQQKAGAMAFVVRYQKAIRRALYECPDEFRETVGYGMKTYNYRRQPEKHLLLIVGDTARVTQQLTLQDEVKDYYVDTNASFCYVVLQGEQANRAWKKIDGFKINRGGQAHFVFRPEQTIEIAHWSDKAMADWHRDEGWSWVRINRS